MANTLKFGNGEWYGKKDTILAYNDENSNYKPLPFDFSRASSATVINKDGLIETVGSGQPRIDYKDDSKGALKLEPSRTNLITQSEAFGNTYWTKSGATIQGDPSTAGSEEVTNGDFATDSNWTKGTGWTISGGKAVSNSSVGFQSLSQSNAISNSNGKTFKCNFTISGYSSGTVALYISGFINNSYFVGANGDYEIYIMVSQGTSGNVEFLTNSSGFTGSIDNVSIKEVQGFTSPDGTTNAYKLVEGTNNGGHTAYKLNASISSGINYTYSVFVKGTERVLQMVLSSGFSSNFCNFDLSDGTIGSNNGLVDSNITSFSNGWYRCDITALSSGTSANLELILAESKSSSRYTTYQGNGTSSIYIYGAQLEAGSYATSYILTQGSAVTRVADSCNNSGNDQVINSTEGVLYLEMSALGNDGTFRYISLINDASNFVQIYYKDDSNRISAIVKSSGSTQFFANHNLSDATNFIKVAIKYKQNDFALWVDGVEVATDISGNTPSDLSELDFDFLGGNKFSGNVRDVKVYNTALTDSELQALTS